MEGGDISENETSRMRTSTASDVYLDVTNNNENESFSILTNSMAGEVNGEEINSSLNDVALQPEQTVLNPSDEDFLDKANVIVDEAIDTATNSFHSSGDFSLLKDAESPLSMKDSQTDAENSCTQDLSATVVTETEETSVNAEENRTIEKTEESLKDTEEKKENKSSSEKKADEWLDILGNGLLKKKVLTPGQGPESRPQRGQEVTINVKSFLSDGTSLEDKSGYKFIVGDLEAIQALDMAVNLMERDEKCLLLSDVKYCKPTDASPSKTPETGEINYNIELLDIQEGPYNSSVPIDKRLLWVDQKRKHGNDLYVVEKYDAAKTAYMKCTRVLQQAANQEQADDVKKEIESFSMKCHNNLAAVHMKLRNWKEALLACQVVEKIDPKNVKTLFRKGKVLSHLGRYRDSIITLKKASSLSPDDKAIQNELSKQQKRLADQNLKQKMMYQRMLGSTTIKQDGERKKDKKSWSGVMWGGSLVAIGAAVLLGVYMMHR